MLAGDKKRKEIVLRVQDPDPSHVGRNIVTLSRKAKEELEITSGDIVEIEATKKTAAVVWPARPEDEGKDIIRMDSLIRRNAGIGLGEKVTIRKAHVEEAKKVVLSPTQEVRIIASGYDRILKRNFIGRPLTKGDNVWISVFGSGFIYIVTETSPRGIVRVTDYTQFILKEEPVKEAVEGVPKVAYEDIGGLEEQVQKVREMIELPMRHPELFRRLGIDPPKGVLLHGPPGCGKTLLAKAVANETNAHFISISAPEVMSKFVGEAEERIRQLFKDAQENAPSIIFIDEIDAIAPKREEVIGEVERRVVAQLLAAMDGMEARGNVIVIAATNRINSIDEALRRPGRFDREIEFPVPDRKGRKEVLQIHTRGMPLAKDVDLDHFANITHGFVGADLSALGKEAAMKALRRYLPEINLEDETIPQEVLEKLEVNKEDFINGLKDVQPSALREVTIEIPNVKWEDIGALDYVKEELRQAVEWPLQNPEAFKKLGIKPPKGILLYGPPGCGKTLIAKALATESGINFISIKGPELLSMYVGESLPFDEELLVFDGKKIFREHIGKIVEERKNLQVVTFDDDGKVLFSSITDFIKHPLNGKLLQITTKTGRRIRVTDKHSLFSLVENEIEAVTPSQLIEGKSVLAVPSKIPNISTMEKQLNLFEMFRHEQNFFIHSPQIKELIKGLGYKKACAVAGIKRKYLYDIVDRNLPLSLTKFNLLLGKSKDTPSLTTAKISRKGSRHSLPALLELSEGLFELIGLWVAEGDFNNGMPRLAICDGEIVKRMQQILDNLGLKYSLIEERGIVINSSTITEVFKKLGLTSGAFNKRMPEILLSAPNNIVHAFLRGYFSGDGTIRSGEGNCKIEATTVSRELANDLAFLFLKLGIVARCKEKREWTGSISHRIQIFGAENFEKFMPIGFIDSRRNLMIREQLNKITWARSNVIPINQKIEALLNEAFVSYPKNITVGKNKLKQALCMVDLNRQKYNELWKLVEADIFWDVVEKIEEVPYKGFVYDVSVEPCQNFIAGFGGIFAHNSERGIRKVFRRARQVAPVIVFFDEIDSIASRRGTQLDSGVTERVVNQLLTELDGIESTKDVIFVAATNRPDLIDPGLLRPGRVDKIIKVDAPDKKARIEILKIHTKKIPLDKNVPIEELAEKTEGYSGADLEGLVREAALIALKESGMKVEKVEKKHFAQAMLKILPSISKETTEAYDEFRTTYSTYKPSYVG